MHLLRFRGACARAKYQILSSFIEDADNVWPSFAFARIICDALWIVNLWMLVKWRHAILCYFCSKRLSRLYNSRTHTQITDEASDLFFPVNYYVLVVGINSVGHWPAIPIYYFVLRTIPHEIIFENWLLALLYNFNIYLYILSEICPCQSNFVEGKSPAATLNRMKNHSSS